VAIIGLGLIGKIALRFASAMGWQAIDLAELFGQQFPAKGTGRHESTERIDYQ
jgi:prephenate dehydrogenase